MELVRAAHSVLATSAFFDGLRETVGKESFARLKLSKREKTLLMSARRSGSGANEDEGSAAREEEYGLATSADDLLRLLTRAQIPMATRYQGWEENTSGPLSLHFEKSARRTLRFLEGLESWRNTTGWTTEQLVGRVAVGAQQHYRSAYRRFAADVPEFGAWANLTEHAATRHSVRAGFTALASIHEQLSHEVSKLSGKLLPSPPLRR